MDARSPAHESWSKTFGAFELDLRSGELRKAGARVPLQALPFRLLTTLLERPGELVSRDELRARLWPAGTFVDFEHGLNAAVRRLRRALDDSAEAPTFVETLQRRGYRFIAAPQALECRDTVQPGNGHRRRLAVWPFHVATEPLRPAGFGDGLMAETMAQLVRFCAPSVAVVARSAVERFRQSPDAATDMHQMLGVDYILEGSLRFSPERVRITAQLIDCVDDTHVWADVYERENGADAMAVQQETALLIARAVSGRLLAPAEVGRP